MALSYFCCGGGAVGGGALGAGAIVPVPVSLWGAYVVSRVPVVVVCSVIDSAALILCCNFSIGIGSGSVLEGTAPVIAMPGVCGTLSGPMSRAGISRAGRG